LRLRLPSGLLPFTRAVLGARIRLVLVRVKNRERSSLRSRGLCLACRRAGTQYGRGGGEGLAGPHVQLGDGWLDGLVARVSERRKPFTLQDWDMINHSDDPSSFVVVFRFGAISVGSVPYRLLRPYLCHDCRRELETLLNCQIEIARARRQTDDARVCEGLVRFGLGRRQCDA